MVAKGQKLTGSALTAARRNIKKATEVRRLKASGLSLAQARSRAGVAVRGSNPKAKTTTRGGGGGGSNNPGGTRFAGNYERFADASSRIALAVGVASIGTSILLGRSAVHPAGGVTALSRPAGVNLDIVNPFTGVVQSGTVVGQDVLSLLTGADKFTGQPAGFGAQLRAAGVGIGYNVRSAFTPGSSGFYFGPAAAGVGIRVAERLTTPLISGAFGMLERATDRIGIRA